MLLVLLERLQVSSVAYILCVYVYMGVRVRVPVCVCIGEMACFVVLTDC